MPRDSSGNYTLPAGNPVEAGTTVSSVWANDTMSDLGNEMSDSLSRSGKGGFTGPVGFISGSVAAPGIGWIDEANTGFYRAAAGDMRATVAGADKARFTTNGLDVFVGAAWQRVSSAPYFQTVSDHAELWGGAAPAKRVSTTDAGAQIDGTLIDVDGGAVTEAINLRLRSQEGGAEVRQDGNNLQLATTDATGATNRQLAAEFIRNGQFRLLHNGTERLVSTGTGIDVAGSLVRARPGSDVQVQIEAATTVGGFQLNVEPSSADVSLDQVDASGLFEKRWLSARRDGTVELLSDGTPMFRTASVAERDARNSGAFVYDAAAIARPVGFNIMASSAAASRAVAPADNGERLRPTAAATYTLNNGSLPAGGTIVVSPLAGAVTIAQGTGVTLNWFTGAGVQTGPRTIATGGWVTITAVTATTYDIAGSGIS